MLEETYRRLAARQLDYWWHRARRAMSAQLLRRHGLAAAPTVLDLGCGPGGNLPLLQSFNPALLVGLDLAPIALSLARAQAPNAALVRANAGFTLPFAANAFDLVTIFNVLYHSWIEDDGAVLAEVQRVLRPNGLLLITEPAFPALARDMDKAGMASRRYRRGDIIALCNVARLEVLFGSYFTCFGFPLLLGTKLLEKIARLMPGAPMIGCGADMRTLPRIANEALYRAASLEANVIARGLPMPFGVTLVCVARRPAPESLSASPP